MAINKLHDSGAEYVKAGGLLDMVRTDGYDVDFQQLGTTLYRMGVEREYKRHDGDRGVFYKVKKT